MGLTVIGIRHGEVHNPEGVIYAGLPGYGLSELGRSQAAEMAEALRDLPLTAIYASPLDRAIQTAGYISELTGVEIVPDIRLHEWRHWQQWAGMTWEDLRVKGRESWEAYQADPGAVTSGESLAELGERMESWLGDVERDHAEGIVLGVTHLEPLRTVLLRAQGRPARDLFDVHIPVGQAVVLRPEADVTALDGRRLRERLVPLV
jgi:broad specificity phosphatase PhoE